MKCDHCGALIEGGQERAHAGQILCEDCYMDLLSPVKACDPWAVYAAQSMRDTAAPLTKVQNDILARLKESDGLELEILAEKLGLPLSELQREVAVLRHMEKVHAAMQGGRKVIRLWD
jgi:predicted Rossmann fold nucleotide-binding protein DprA/Smf involved in DNA uptake